MFNFYRFVVLLLIAHATTCYAESAIESIKRTTKNPTLKVAPADALLTQKERAAQIEKAKALAVLPQPQNANDPNLSAPSIKPLQPAAPQRVEEIIVEAQREPEDIVPITKSPMQKMQAKLDGAGKSAPMIIAESKSADGTRSAVFNRNGKCYVIKNNAGRMNHDGSLGSSGRDAVTCSKIELEAK